MQPKEPKNKAENRFIQIEPEAITVTDHFPICPECGTYLHLREDDKHVCRNETCPNYS